MTFGIRQLESFRQSKLETVAKELVDVFPIKMLEFNPARGTEYDPYINNDRSRYITLNASLVSPSYGPILDLKLWVTQRIATHQISRTALAC